MDKTLGSDPVPPKTYDNAMRIAFMKGVQFGWRAAGNTRGLDTVPPVEIIQAYIHLLDLLAAPSDDEECILCGVERGQPHARSDCLGIGILIPLRQKTPGITEADIARELNRG